MRCVKPRLASDTPAHFSPVAGWSVVVLLFQVVLHSMSPASSLNSEKLISALLNANAYALLLIFLTHLTVLNIIFLWSLKPEMLQTYHTRKHLIICEW